LRRDHDAERIVLPVHVVRVDVRLLVVNQVSGLLT
jgi:hypothetical protein